MTRSEIINVDYRELNEAAEILFNISDVESLYQMFGKCKSWDEVNEAAADWLDVVTEVDDNCVRRELEETPYDHTFIVDNRDEMCHATGYEVFIHGIWWNEYIDSLGEYHYGN